MQLSKRLMEIVSYIEEDSVVADIGTDHGYIPVYLIKNNISRKVIAADISKPSLDKTIGYVRDLMLEDYIDTRCGDGLKVLRPNEVDTVVIAGMGGILMEKILEADLEITNSIEKFILQPMIAAKELRYYLFRNNFDIIDESLVYEEGKYYEIIYAIHGKGNKEIDENDIYLDISKKLIENKDPLLEDFIQSKIEYTESIMDKVKLNKSEKSLERLKELETTVRRYKEVLDDYESSQNS